MERLPVAVIGVGHLGKEHARILSSLPGAELVAVVDPNRTQAEVVAERCKTIPYVDHHDILDRVRAAVIATPTICHHAVAREFLRKGKHLLVEKPLTTTVAQADELVELARKNKTILQVGHIERFNPAFEELQSRSIRPRYISSERFGVFTGRSTDVGVVLDLMIHDLDLILTLVDAPLLRVEALGVAVLGGHEDIAQARLTFTNGCIVDLSASRTHPEAVRRMRVWGAEGHVSADFATRRLTLMQPSEILRQGGIDSRRLSPNLAANIKAELFQRFVQVAELDCSQRHAADQLTRELEDFVHCASTGAQPRVDGEAGLSAVEVADRVLTAIRSHAWNGNPEGPVGPNQLPTPQGWLFAPAAREAA